MARNRYSLRQMTNAIVRDDGLAIKLMFMTHEGKDLELECPPTAALEIVARLMGALAQVAKSGGPIKEAIGLHADKYALGAALKGRPALLVHFFPMSNCPIGFHLDLDVADKLAADLPSVIATIRKGSLTTH